MTLRHNCKELKYCGNEVTWDQGRNEGGRIPRVPNYYGSTEWLRGAPKSPNNVTSTFFKTFASKRPQFRIWGRQLSSCSGRHL